MTDILFFSSPIGLGHATRDSAIAGCLKGASLRFVSGGHAAKFLAGRFDADDAYSPPAFDVRGGRLQGKLRWLWRYYRYYNDCKSISEKIIARHKPELVISDEDFASLAVAQERGIRTILVTDILETRFASGVGGLIEKRMNRSMRDLAGKCNAVILPERGANNGNIIRVGPITRKTSSSREELRKKYRFEGKTILVSVGGTDAGGFLIRKMLRIAPNLPDDMQIVLATGPALKIECGEGIRNLGFVANLHELIFAADVLVSLAGKSTIDEGRAYGTPAIFIPILGHFEQEDNAKDEGFSHEDLNRLEGLISEKIKQKRNPAANDGAQQACGVIEKALGKSNA